MACFDSIISYKGGCSSVSGLLLDELVSVEEVEKFVDDSYLSASELIDDKIDFAIRHVVNELNSKFSKQYIPKTILENKRAGFFNEVREEVAAEAKRKGVEIEVCNKESYYSLYVSQIDTYFNYTGSVSIKVIDTMTGETLDTIVVESVADQIVTTYVDKTYNADKRKRRIAFVYDATSIPNYKTSLIGEGCTSCNKGRYQLSGFIQGRSISAPTSGDVILANISGESDTSGLSIVFSLQCNNESWICTNRNLLALPILYKTAEMLMTYALDNSSRFNTKTAINLERLEAREMKYKEDYDSQMKHVLMNIYPPTDGICFQCRRRNQYVTTLP